MKWGEVFTLLDKIALEGPTDRSVGICTNFKCMAYRVFDTPTIEASRVLRVIFDRLYVDVMNPVKHPYLDASYAYMQYAQRHALWDRSDEYGRNRWQLLHNMMLLCAANPKDDEVGYAYS